MTSLLALGDVHWKHAGYLHSLAVSHNGTMVAGGGLDLSIWSLDGTLQHRLRGTDVFLLSCICWSWNDQWLAVVGNDLALWDPSTGVCVERIAWDVCALVAVAEHGLLALVREEQSLAIYSVVQRRLLSRIHDTSTVGCFSSDGKWVALALGDKEPGALAVYDVQTGVQQRVLRSRTEFSYEQEAHDMWGETYVEHRTEKVSFRCVAMSEDNTRVAAVSNSDEVVCWEWSKSDVPTCCKLEERGAWQVRFSPSGEELFVARCMYSGGSLHALLWNVRSQAVRKLELRGVRVCTGMFLSNDRLLLGGSCHRVIEVALGETVSFSGLQRFDHHVSAMCFGADNTSVLVHDDGGLHRVRLEEGARETWTFPIPAQTYGALALDRADTIGVVGDSSAQTGMDAKHYFGMYLFDPRSGTPLRRLSPTSTLTFALVLSPDRTLLAVVGYRAPVSLWSLVSNTVVATLLVDDARNAVFLPDGKGLVVALQSGALAVFRWEETPLETMKPTGMLLPTTQGSSAAPNDDARSIVVSDDGKCVVSAWNDVVRVWSLETEKQVGGSAAISRDAVVLAVGFDRAQRPGGLLLHKKTMGTYYSETSILWWTAQQTTTLWRTGAKDYFYGVRGCLSLDGTSAVFVADDGVPRWCALP